MSRFWNPLRFLGWLSRKTKVNKTHRIIPQNSHNDPLRDTSKKVNPRYSACIILYEAGLPCVFWGEDALAAYDIPTVVFDLFLLVNDPERATQVLASHGFIRTTPNPRFEKIPQMADNVPRLAQIPPSTINDGLPMADDWKAPGVILLPADYWGYKLPSTVDLHTFIPPLSTLLNTLINVWFDLPEKDSSLREHIAIHIGYFYLYNQDVRNPDFENQLDVGNRQVHFEMLPEYGWPPHGFMIQRKCQEYHRNIRNQIRLGQYQPGKIENWQYQKIHPSGQP